MVSSGTRWRAALERWSPALFVLAGVALGLLLAIGFAVRHMAASIPRTAYWPLFPLAFALSLAGLLGLAPRLVERARRSALFGAGFAAIGATLHVSGLGALLVASPPGPYPGSLGLLGAPFFLGLLAFVLAVGIYGVLVLRTGTPSRLIGAVLLLVALLQFGELIGAEVLFESAGTGAPSGTYVLFETGVYGLIAAALVVVGDALRRDSSRTGAEHPVGTHESSVEAS